jgi:starch phosphorylase
VVFFPDFKVASAQAIYPGADLSQHISTAGLEASGTGNMKFGLNGALAIGTLDGANIEIREAVGAENFFCFGLTAEEVRQRRAQGYRPRAVYEDNAELREALDLVASGAFSPGEPRLFEPLVRSLLDHDPYMALADYPLYIACQDQVSRTWRDPEQWVRMSILNVARMGWFSSDRAVAEYCRDVWHVEPLPITLR